MSADKGNKALSFRAIEVMKPTDSDKADNGVNRGLRVTCGKTGKKTFFYRYTSPVTNKLIQISLGVFPAVSLEQARIKLRELKLIRQQGRCPATEARAAALELKQQIKNESELGMFTLQAMIELYLQNHIEDQRLPNGTIKSGARKKKGQAEARRTLYGDAVPMLGERLACDVSRQDIIDLVMSIVNRGANVQAGNVLREILAAYDYSMGMGKFDDQFINPALQAKVSLVRTKVKLTSKKGSRFLNDDEIKLFLAWLPSSKFTEVQKNIFRMTLWTGCRTGEICEATWRNIDLNEGVFHIRESKTGVAREIQLPRQCIHFLRINKIGNEVYLFPSQRTGKPIKQKQLTESAWVMREADLMLDIPRWTPHDLRRTVRTGLSRLQCPSEVAEAILGHTKKGLVGTYDLHRYTEQSREWLQRWADHLDTLVTTS
ncbi:MULTISPECIES: site-specific integrase [Aeromonas]|uniref:tyrosine-type recombinase/integrase n=1 Tax=Aeromonas TaxID=642 RepID=UPI000DD79ABB|nr:MULTISPECIES: site-specific integrase [Aeromonas]AXB01058.1 tyrosine-type recombinase/integrase [Aeromonas caviae]QXC00510.1 tyrosine-type recombinase/integrase [Aeromonas sp. FDAARGOS 1418]UBS65904.1 tyrosine-type recombinase/integrase [Aeromonas caviae]WKS85368.1 tyrosine-type recombinase/integrase [Aeromonas caviae]BDC85100.1 integrase [Aeromonas caviae]